MQKSKTTFHHQVPESMGWTRHRDNLFRIPDHRHQAFHIVFWNRTFIGQLLSLTRINATSLSQDIKQDVNTLIWKYQGEDELYAYKEWVLVPRKFLEGQAKFYKK